MLNQHPKHRVECVVVVGRVTMTRTTEKGELLSLLRQRCIHCAMKQTSATSRRLGFPTLAQISTLVKPDHSNRAPGQQALLRCLRRLFS